MSKPAWCIGVLLVAACAPTRQIAPIATMRISDEPARAAVEITAPPKPPTPPPTEVVREIAGFTVHVSPAAQRSPELDDFLVALEVHLADVVQAFPILARLRLRRIGIFLTEREARGPIFHPEDTWLRDRGLDVGLAKNIEVPSVDLALKKLREGDKSDFATYLAAGYFVRRDDVPWSEAQSLYEAAKKGKLESAEMASDGVTYFARLSAAYYGRLGVPDRTHLCATDRAGCAFLQRLWPIDHAPDAPRVQDVAAHVSHGFTVWIEKSALSHSETNVARTLVDEKLGELAKWSPDVLVPLRRAKVVVRWSTAKDETAAIWFHDGFVDIPDVAAYVKAERSTPNAIFHEFGHALDAARPDLSERKNAAYNNAMATHLYDNVERDGKSVRGYATVNAEEYFANLSKAYVSSGAEEFPHTREELEHHDPLGYRLMVDAWGAPP